MIQYPIPEPYRTRLVDAGIAVCSHHFPRTITDRHGNPDFVATAEYRVAHKAVEDIIKTLPTSGETA